MRPQRDDGAAALMAEVDAVDHVLWALRVPVAAHDDLRQDVVIATWQAGQRGLLTWASRAAVRACLRIVAMRAAYHWHRDNPLHGELRCSEAVATVDPERLFLGKATLRFLRLSTTPERWKVMMAYAKGISVADIARRERLPVGTVYNRIRLTRKDFAAALAKEDAAIFVRRRLK